MSSARITLTFGFWVSLLAMIVLWVASTLHALSKPLQSDEIIYGFPLPFYSVGGLCPHPCPNGFAWPILLFDAIVLAGVPLLANWLILRRRHKIDTLLHRRRKSDKERDSW